MKYLIFLIFGLIFLPGLTSLASPSLKNVESDREGSIQQYEFVLDIYGNADMNWIIDDADLEYIEAVIKGTAHETQYADADGDGIIGPKDLAKVKEIIAGKAKSITVIDASGSRVTIQLPVNRIVTLVPWGTRTLVQLGVQSRIVGIDTYTTRGSKYADLLVFLRVCPWLTDLTNLGTSDAPNKEVMASLHPDLILAGQIKGDQIEILKKTSGCPSVFQPRDSTRGTDYAIENGPYENWLTLGYILGKKDRALDIIAFCEKEFREIGDRLKNLTRTQKKTAWYCSGKINRGSWMYSPILLAGGAMPSEEGTPFFGEIQLEQVLKWDPDIIFVQYWPHLSGMIKEIKNNKVLSFLKAVKNNQLIYLRNGRLGHDSGFSAAEVWYIAKILYPDRFMDINVEQRANKVLEFLYGTPGLYTWEINKRPVFKIW